MTTPVRAKSLTTKPRGQVPMAAPPPPLPPPAPKLRKHYLRRFRTWQRIQRYAHPFAWWVALIVITLISLRILIGAMATWPVFRGYLIVLGVFWFTCIGMLPITAIARTGINVTKEIFDND